jgi:spermidine/putrescine transport system permease protein
MLLPVALPSLVIGVMLLVLFQILGLRLSLFGSILAGHVLYTVPYVFLVVYLRLQRLPQALEEAAWDLGAGRVVTLTRVILPLISPAIAGGALLAFLLSFDEFIITFFLAGTEKTLPLFIWDEIFRIINPQLAALSLLLLLLTIALVTGIHFLTGGERGDGEHESFGAL